MQNKTGGIPKEDGVNYNVDLNKIGIASIQSVLRKDAYYSNIQSKS